MRTRLWFLSATVTHFLASAAAFLWRYSNGSSAFDGHHVSPVSVLLADALFAFSWFPFGHLLMAAPASKLLPGLWGWLPVLINSMFWGAVVTTGVWYKRRRLST